MMKINDILVRVAREEDLEKVLEVYKTAREFMKQTGNPTQWGDWYPPKAYLVEDINSQRLYVLERDGEINGVFMYFVGADPNYAVIEDGNWSLDKEYGVIHRVASNGKMKGVFSTVLTFALTKADYVRIDTHANNTVMQKTLKKHGFKPCGRVYMIDDGTPRIAFDLIKE